MSHQLVHACGHVKLNTNRMEDVLRDSTDILGLRITRQTDKEVWLSSNGRAAELVYVESDENSAHTIGLEALSQEDVLRAHDRIEEAGCKIVSTDPSMDCMRAGVTFQTPEGLQFEIHTPSRDDRYNPRYDTVGVGPRRIDHINLISPDPKATEKQLGIIGDLRQSERMVDYSLSWYYGGNRQHHILGIVKRDVPGIHHYSFEFLEFEMYCRLGDTLRRHDKWYIWGPGRHKPGDNTYAYYLDSSGCIVEISGAMSTIGEEVGFEPRVITNLKRPDNVVDMNVWGTPAPQEWRTHTHPFMKVG